MTEYILILSVVVLIVVRFRKTIMEKILGATDKVGASIDSALEE
jgi:Flp pilus assembly pilin Flp